MRGQDRQQQAGRDEAGREDRRGADPVVIIGYDIWNNRYGRDPNIIGRVLKINGSPATIVGVMPDGMKFPDDSELWVPFIPNDGQMTREVRPLSVFGRLAADVTKEQASTEIDGIAQRIMKAHPNQAKNVVGHEPFALLFPDDVIAADPPCTKQMIDVYDERGGSVIAVQEVPDSEVESYGIVAGNDEGGGVVRATALVEKFEDKDDPTGLEFKRVLWHEGVHRYTDEVMPGAPCPECGNSTLIRKDGCDYCTACGYVGVCG